MAGTALGALGWLLFRELHAGAGNGSSGEATDVDLTALRGALRSAGAPEIRVRSLAPGIVELVGRVDAAARGERLLDVAARQPGVSVVVNRLWHPVPEVTRSRPDPDEPGRGAN